MLKNLLSQCFIALIVYGCMPPEEDDTQKDFSATIEVSATSTTVNEADGDITINFNLSEANASGSALQFSLSLTGSATQDSDFTLSSSTVSIASGSSSGSTTLSIIDDTETETAETVTIAIASLPESVTGSNTSVSITISDNDEEDGGDGDGTGTGTDEKVILSFGTATGNQISINSWTDISADSYIIFINSSNQFSEVALDDDPAASTTYVGFGEQVVFNGSIINAFDIQLLSQSATYYFKVVPITSSAVDNDQEVTSHSTLSCSYSSTTQNEVCFDVSSQARIISSNQYPSHAVGKFPNADPTAIEVTRTLVLSPSYSGTPTYVYNETGGPTPMNDNFYQFGIAINGVEFHPMGLKPWENPNIGEQNWEWQAKVTEEGETDLDAYGAHVTSQGLYHYHGDIVGLATEEDGSKHSSIYGFAADGFPIYYKYAYTDANDEGSAIKELKSSYQLKSGSRTGIGTAGEDYPSGNYDGSYIQDFEYVQGLGDLDECNGRTGVTPEYPEGTYYYVITSDFPKVPNCFMGTPDDDWKIGK